MAEYLITITRKYQVDDSVSSARLRSEIKQTLDDIKGQPCRTVNGLQYTPVSNSIIHVIRSSEK